MYKCFVIYLENNIKSVEFSKLTYNKLLSLNMDVELFKGTPALEAECIFQKQNRTLINTEENKQQLRSYNGVKGCFYSHYMLWDKCVKHDNPILIFEDDVEIKREFFPVNWNDILVLSLPRKDSWLQFSDYFNNFEKDKSQQLKIDNLNAEIFKNDCMTGTSGYAIKPSAAKKLINYYNNTYTAVDRAINKSIVDIYIHPLIMGRELPLSITAKSLTIKSDKYK